MKLLLTLLIIPLFTLIGAEKPIQLRKKAKTMVKNYVPVGDNLYANIYETSNIDYREFLAHLKKNDQDAYQNFAVDSVNWLQGLKYNEPFVEFYHKHQAYNNYPVVNIDIKGAEAYCNWLTKLYNNNPEREYKEVKYRLPTHDEWKLAASSNNKLYNPYPWGGPFLRNSKGCYLANFHPIYEGAVKYDKDGNYTIGGGIETDKFTGFTGNLNLSTTITVPVESYFPNEFGLYNCAGNAAEITAEGLVVGGSWNDPGYYLQIESVCDHLSAEEANPQTGFRVFMEVIEE